MSNVHHQSTRSIHGTSLKDQHGAPHLPTYNTTTFTFESTQALLEVIDGKTPGALYTRYGMNPTIYGLEETMASIEDAEACLGFCSGIAAEVAVFTQYGRDGVVCLGDVYGGTLELLTDQLPLLGIETSFVLGTELEKLEGILQQGAKLVFFETPTNPALEIFDISAISNLAHKYGALVAIDNTFGSPVNQRPLEFDADLVVYSATKYLGGHSDITAGFVLGSSELVTPINGWRKSLGSVIAPETAALLARSLRTLTIRVRAQSQAAQVIAEALETDQRVRRVLYPGLQSFPNHVLAARQMSNFGGVLTIEVDADAKTTAAVADRLELFGLGPSLGGTESLATQPVTTTHHDLSVEERDRRGITDSMIRLSIGLEDPDDLVADLRQALDVVSQ